jgi:hypothetical protein
LLVLSDTFLSMKHFLLLLSSIAFSGVCIAQSVPEGDPSLIWNDTDHEWFNKQRIYDNDKDADKMLSSEEVLAGEPALAYFKVRTHFEDTDRLKDEKLSNEEIRVFNQHEKQWLMEAQLKGLDSLQLLSTWLKVPSRETAEKEPTVFQKVLGNSYWLNHHSDFIKTCITDSTWLAGHVKETKILLNNKLWLAQHPELANQLYPLTEAIWKRDAILSRWIRKHILYIAEYRG